MIGCLAGISADARSQSTSAISSNFNGTSIAGTSYIWFNAHLTDIKFSGEAVGAPEVILYVKNSRITFTSNGSTYEIAVPDSILRFSNSTTQPSGAFAGGRWEISHDKSGSKDPFMGGLMWKVPQQGLPGGTNPVTWTAEFSSNIDSIGEIKWQWAAAVYTQAPSDPNELLIQWIDGSRQSGTPLACTSHVTGGARGGGGSNFTGSNSSTISLKNIAVIPDGDPTPPPVGELTIPRNLLVQGSMVPVGYKIIRQ